MLQNEAQSEVSPPPGQRRITPEELSQAVAAIEQRKQQEAQRLAGTIPIEEAVSSLHLDATPEEIWAQVQAQREAESARQAAAEAARQAQQARQAQVLPPQTQMAPRGRRGPWRRLVAIGVVLWTAHAVGFGPHFGHSAAPPPPALTATVAQIPDGKEFSCDTAGLVQISEGKAVPEVRVGSAPHFENSWTLVKMNGHVYLRAYTAPLDSVQAVKGQPLVLYNDDNSGTLDGVRTAQTTVRVDGVPLQISGGSDGHYTEITMPDFQPDAYTTTSPWR